MLHGSPPATNSMNTTTTATQSTTTVTAARPAPKTPDSAEPLSRAPDGWTAKPPPLEPKELKAERPSPRRLSTTPQEAASALSDFERGQLHLARRHLASLELPHCDRPAAVRQALDALAAVANLGHPDVARVAVELAQACMAEPMVNQAQWDHPGPLLDLLLTRIDLLPRTCAAQVAESALARAQEAPSFEAAPQVEQLLGVATACIARCVDGPERAALQAKALQGWAALALLRGRASSDSGVRGGIERAAHALAQDPSATDALAQACEAASSYYGERMSTPLAHAYRRLGLVFAPGSPESQEFAQLQLGAISSLTDRSPDELMGAQFQLLVARLQAVRSARTLESCGHATGLASERQQEIAAAAQKLAQNCSQIAQRCRPDLTTPWRPVCELFAGSYETAMRLAGLVSDASLREYLRSSLSASQQLVARQLAAYAQKSIAAIRDPNAQRTALLMFLEMPCTSAAWRKALVDITVQVLGPEPLEHFQVGAVAQRLPQWLVDARARARQAS